MKKKCLRNKRKNIPFNETLAKHKERKKENERLTKTCSQVFANVIIGRELNVDYLEKYLRFHE